MGDKLKTKVKNVGKMAYGLLNNNYLVLFDNPEDEFNIFGYTIEPTSILDEIKVGDTVIIGNEKYTIKDLSEDFNKKLKDNVQFELIIDREFDDENQILLDGNNFPTVEEGTEIIIKEN